MSSLRSLCPLGRSGDTSGIVSASHPQPEQGLSQEPGTAWIVLVPSWWSCSFTSYPYIVKVKLKKKKIKKAKTTYTLTKNKIFHSWKGVLEQGKTPVSSRHHHPALSGPCPTCPGSHFTFPFQSCSSEAHERSLITLSWVGAHRPEHLHSLLLLSLTLNAQKIMLPNHFLTSLLKLKKDL